MLLETAIKKLGQDFQDLNWSFFKENIDKKEEIVSYWPGDPKEDIMLCVLKANHIAALSTKMSVTSVSPSADML